MSELSKIIETRRSVRNFKADKVPKELINEIMVAGTYAASGRGKQSTKIIAITNGEMRKKIAETNSKIAGWKKEHDPFYGAPIILLVIAEIENGTAAYEGSLTMGNMMLKAEELGLGSCWIHRAKEEFEGEIGKEILEKLDLKGQYEGVGHLALGYAKEKIEKIPERKDGRIFYID